jgi:hypothetical protein
LLDRAGAAGPRAAGTGGRAYPWEARSCRARWRRRRAIATSGDPTTIGARSTRPIRPVRADSVEPLDLRELLRRRWLVDVEVDPLRFRYRLVGTGHRDAIGENGKVVMRDNAHTLLGQASERPLPYSRAAMREIRAPTLLSNGAHSSAFFHAPARCRSIAQTRGGF